MEPQSFRNDSVCLTAEIRFICPKLVVIFDLCYNSGLTRTEIIGNAMLMLLAGYETTGNSMVFLAYNLATHQHVQDKLREEIMNAIEKYVSTFVNLVNSLGSCTLCNISSLPATT